MTVVGSHKVPLDKFTDETYMNGIFEELKNENADLTIWCTYETGCQAMSDGYKRMGNYGNAIAFIICTGLDSFEQYAGADLIDFLGVSLWNEQIPGADAYTGQTPLEFSNQVRDDDRARGRMGEGISSDVTNNHSLVASPLALHAPCPSSSRLRRGVHLRTRW